MEAVVGVARSPAPQWVPQRLPRVEEDDSLGGRPVSDRRVDRQRSSVGSGVGARRDRADRHGHAHGVGRVLDLLEVADHVRGIHFAGDVVGPAVHDEDVGAERKRVVGLPCHPAGGHAVLGDHAAILDDPVGVIQQSVEPRPLGDVTPGRIEGGTPRDRIAEEDSDRSLFNRHEHTRCGGRLRRSRRQGLGRGVGARGCGIGVPGGRGRKEGSRRRRPRGRGNADAHDNEEGREGREPPPHPDHPPIETRARPGGEAGLG